MRSRRWIAGRSRDGGRARAAGGWCCAEAAPAGQPTLPASVRGIRARIGLAPVARRQGVGLVDAEAGVRRLARVGHDGEVAVLPVRTVDGHIDADRLTGAVAPHEHPVGAGLQGRAPVVRHGLELRRRAGLRRELAGARVEVDDAEGSGADDRGGGDREPGAHEVATSPPDPAAVDQTQEVGWRHRALLGLEAEGRAQLLVEAHAPPASCATPEAASARRSADIAADDCDFTVPGAHPIVSAICASVMSS